MEISKQKNNKVLKGAKLRLRKKEKKCQDKISLEISTLLESRIEQDLDLDLGQAKMRNKRGVSHLPTNIDMETMFGALENSLKTEMAIIHKDLGHMLTRVEEVGERNGPLNKYDKSRKIDKQTYRLEDQVNRDRRKNLRITRPSRIHPDRTFNRNNKEDI